MTVKQELRKKTIIIHIFNIPLRLLPFILCKKQHRTHLLTLEEALVLFYDIFIFLLFFSYNLVAEENSENRGKITFLSLYFVFITTYTQRQYQRKAIEKFI